MQIQFNSKVLEFIKHLFAAFGRILDNLPLIVPVRRPDQELSTVYQHGFYVGLRGQYAGVSSRAITICTTLGLFYEKCSDHFFLSNHLQSKDEKHFINNHLTFTVKFHKDPETDSSRIVGFEVKPFRSYL